MGRHLHGRGAGLALRCCLVGDAAGGERLAEIEGLAVCYVADRLDVQQTGVAEQQLPIGYGQYGDIMVPVAGAARQLHAER